VRADDHVFVGQVAAGNDGEHVRPLGERLEEAVVTATVGIGGLGEGGQLVDQEALRQARALRTSQAALQLIGGQCLDQPAHGQSFNESRGKRRRHRRRRCGAGGRALRRAGRTGRRGSGDRARRCRAGRLVRRRAARGSEQGEGQGQDHDSLAQGRVIPSDGTDRGGVSPPPPALPARSGRHRRLRRGRPRTRRAAPPRRTVRGAAPSSGR
jgi:hypothetical protein